MYYFIILPGLCVNAQKNCIFLEIYYLLQLGYFARTTVPLSFELFTRKNTFFKYPFLFNNLQMANPTEEDLRKAKKEMKRKLKEEIEQQEVARKKHAALNQMRLV